ncbi:MAG: stage II sporulation protein M [Actinomycetota bacterium]|nr:stage II sporulation protein M [Actinomycetota bacterium]
MNANELVLVQGMAATKEALREWYGAPWRTLRTWLGWSLLTAVGLLLAILLVATLAEPDSTRLVPAGEDPRSDAVRILTKNSLVLALHAMACVAGFLAGSAVPQQAQHKTGLNKWVHEKAGPFAIAFVVCATTFSLATQAYILGHDTSTIAEHLGLSPATLLMALSLHAIPELTALFLPLAAWVVASRRGEWHKLLAATAVTVAVAVPTLVLTALVEIYVTPRLIVSLMGG